MTTSAPPNASAPPTLTVKDLRVMYDTPEGQVKAVNGVDFTLHAGERFALVGESGCGKTTLALTLMRLLKPPARIDDGSVILGDRDILQVSEDEMRQVRLNEIALVPQGAMNSLNPVMRVEEQIIDGMVDHGLNGTKEELRLRAIHQLRSVGLSPVVARMYPHELSGGMKQRVAMAIATALRPKVIIADEPTSALDVVVQRQVMTTLVNLQAELGASVILVGHDMGLVAQFAERVGVMYAG
ncbi:MAG: ABC transporter ATP-binding protein, partial [Chloroflexi bacterium]|nr:ABC transporter ATP-binding protein [Chloroflexota bacterium]